MNARSRVLRTSEVFALVLQNVMKKMEKRTVDAELDLVSAASSCKTIIGRIHTWLELVRTQVIF